MARVINKNLDKAIESEIRAELLKEFKNVHSGRDVDWFFSKFMTNDEKRLVFRRLAVMKLMNQGKKYRDIKEILNISSNTISNVIDIIQGRGYGRNPNRKRQYSAMTKRKKYKSTKFFRPYKGAESII